MKKYLLVALFYLSLCVSSCYDDSALWNSIKDHESRIAKLELLCGQLNTNVQSMNDIITSLKNNEHASNISPIMENDKVIGYTIAFSNGKSVTVYVNNATDVTVPSIGVKKDADSIYYWTLNGEWIKDASGNKIPTSGKDGVTPKLKVEDGYWYASYDGGNTWTKIENASAGSSETGSSFFKDVQYDDKYIYLTHNDGTVLTILRQSHFAINFNLDDVVWTPGRTSKLMYTLSGTAGKSDIFTISENYWVTEVVQTSETEGYISVSLPEYDYEEGRFTLWVSNNGNTVVKRVTFLDADCSAIDVDVPEQTIGYAGGNLVVSYCSGVETELIIPEDAKEWLSIVETRSPSCYNKTLHFTENNYLERSATVLIKNQYLEHPITFTQAAHPNVAVVGFFISVDKNVISSDGEDFVTLKATLNGADVTSGTTFYLVDGKNLTPLTSNVFSTDKAGDYSFKADHLTFYTEEAVVVTAINAAIPAPAVDPMPSNTSFVHRSFLTEYAGTGCPYCPGMTRALRCAFNDEETKNMAVLATVHSYGTGDPAYIAAPRAAGYPYLEIDMVSGFTYDMDPYAEGQVLKNALREKTSQPAKVGISANPSLEGDLLVVRIAVKAAETGDYRLGVWFLQDNIYGQQTDKFGIVASDNSYNYHDDCVRKVDSRYQNNYAGYPIGTIKAGETVERTFVLKVEAEDWKLKNMSDLHFVAFVSSVKTEISDKGRGYSYVGIDNVVDCKYNEPTPFEYNK